MWRNILAAMLLISISAAMAAVFAAMWIVGAVTVTEANSIVRSLELAFFSLVFLFGIERLIAALKERIKR